MFDNMYELYQWYLDRKAGRFLRKTVVGSIYKDYDSDKKNQPYYFRFDIHPIFNDLVIDIRDSKYDIDYEKYSCKDFLKEFYDYPQVGYFKTIDGLYYIKLDTKTNSPGVNRRCDKLTITVFVLSESGVGMTPIFKDSITLIDSLRLNLYTEVDPEDRYEDDDEEDSKDKVDFEIGDDDN